MGIVQFPAAVQIALDALPAGPQALLAANRLSARYRAPAGGAILHDQNGRLAYAAARMPATYAAITQALARLRMSWPDFAPATLLDAGCGPGTASLAASQIFPDLTQVTQSDIDRGWQPLATQLSAAIGHPALARPRWLTGDLSSIAFPLHDLVVAGYSLNELPEDRLAAAAHSLWSATAETLAIIEPGTPKGFQNVRRFRAELIRLGAHVVAPCSHDADCPMTGKDWCHMGVRAARSAMHRELKQARLPYEDEKFSYVIVTRRSVPERPNGRIVKRPVAHSGHVTLDLCDRDGLARTIVSRRDGALYKAARNAEWGDAWPPAGKNP
jgi:ribosomal protein RSM22 (predicted rRNA methylase)